MTRKDFELIAAVIRCAHISELDRQVLAHFFASRLAATNDRFNERKFVNACMERPRTGQEGEA